MTKNSFVAEVTFKLYLDIGDVIHVNKHKASYFGLRSPLSLVV